MVIYSEEIENKLLDIFLKEFAYNFQTPQYYKMKEILLDLDKPYKQRNEPRYPAWKQMKWFEKQIGNYVFGYSVDGSIVALEECFEDISESLKPLTNIGIIKLMMAMELEY